MTRQTSLSDGEWSAYNGARLYYGKADHARTRTDEDKIMDEALSAAVRKRLINLRESAGEHLKKCFCPIFTVDDKDRPFLTGSCVPIVVGGVPFLITAAHVLDARKSSTLYITNEKDFIELEGKAHFIPMSSSCSRNDDIIDLDRVDIGPFRRFL